MLARSLFLCAVLAGPGPGIFAAELSPAGAVGPPPLTTTRAGGSTGVVPDAKGLGYTLVVPRFSTDTILLDGSGRPAHVWPSASRGGSSARMLPDGSLLRLASSPLPAPFNQLGVSGGRLQHIAWDGRLLWDFPGVTSDHIAYGDLVKLPNGNILVSVLEFKSRQECESRGREPGLLTDKGMLVPGLMEFAPKGKSAGLPVWKWSLWDHLYQVRHPHLPEYKFGGAKAGAVDLGSLPGSKGPVWMTPAEIDYLPGEDLVLMVMGGLGEVWVIDHGTTFAEASSREGGRRGSGGQLLLRWKGPPGKPGAMQPPVSRVLSSRWLQDPGPASAPALLVMRYEGQPFKPVIETLFLNPESLQPVGAPQVVFRPASGGEDDALPSGMDWLPASRVALFANALHGRLSLLGEGAVHWTHTNAHGMVKLKPQVVKPGEECCGNATPPGKDAKDAKSGPANVEAAKLPEIDAAPVSRVRLYPPGFLKL